MQGGPRTCHRLSDRHHCFIPLSSAGSLCTCFHPRGGSFPHSITRRVHWLLMGRLSGGHALPLYFGVLSTSRTAIATQLVRPIVRRGLLRMVQPVAHRPKLLCCTHALGTSRAHHGLRRLLGWLFQGTEDPIGRTLHSFREVPSVQSLANSSSVATTSNYFDKGKGVRTPTLLDHHPEPQTFHGCTRAVV